MIHAAGIMFVRKSADEPKILFLKRGPGSDHAGEWCFPGGHIEAGETAEQAAIRETEEELGPVPYGNPTYWTRTVSNNEVAGQLGREVNSPLPNGDAIVVPGEQVDFTTFIAPVNDEFTPKLNGEHVGWAWAPATEPPEPLHPGCRVALARLTMDELGVARAIAAGDLTSPQKYENLWLFAIRITGTGMSYRAGLDEFCWRDPAIYLNDEFLARCNGLPVIFEHPSDKPMLDSEEFSKRAVGTVVLPFIKGDEVWAVAKIYDDATAELMQSEQLSTSPAVVFTDPSVNDRLQLEDGSKLLIEGKPALLDHIAICERGVWDKGGAPSGVLSVPTDMESLGMTEEEKAAAEKARKDNEELAAKLDAALKRVDELNARLDAVEQEREERERADNARKDAARKDRFAPRKDGESDEDYTKRQDADEDDLRKELEAKGENPQSAKDAAHRARKDAEAEDTESGEARADLEGYEEGGVFHPIRNSDGYKRSKAGDPRRRPRRRHDSADDEGDLSAREDSDREAEREETARKDSAVQENADLKARLAAMEAKMAEITRQVSPADRDALAAAQSRADSVAALFGERVDPPLAGETPLAYRKRLLDRFKKHSAKFKETRFDSADASMVDVIEKIVYQDAADAARKPASAPAGLLIAEHYHDDAGRKITKWHGDPMAWMQHFSTGAQIGRIVRNPNALH